MNTIVAGRVKSVQRAYQQIGHGLPMLTVLTLEVQADERCAEQFQAQIGNVLHIRFETPVEETP